MTYPYQRVGNGRLPERLATLQRSLDALAQAASKVTGGETPTDKVQALTTAFATLEQTLDVLDAAVKEQRESVDTVKYANDLLEHSADARDRLDRVVSRLLYQSLVNARGDKRKSPV